MNWIEVIEVRTTEKARGSLIERVTPLINELNTQKSLFSATLFVNLNLGTDISIHIHHHTGPTENEGSTIGLCLVRNLAEFGMLNHQVWKKINITGHNPNT